MEMNSHQKVPVSQAVANAHPNSPLRRQEPAWRTSQASVASEISCSHQSGWPLHGAAIDSA